ncbi:retrovirus-related pol polyprotein from transposon TNT 1-94, partial [Tanacetum coccineum]
SPPLQSYAPTVVQQSLTFQPDTGLAIPTFLPTDDPLASLNKAMMFLSSVYRSKFHPTNNQLRTSSNLRTQATLQNGQVLVQNVQGANQPRVIRCYNCNGEGHMAKQCTVRKRVKDSEWFKEKMLLAQAQEAGVVLNEEQHDFLADSLEETDDCEDLQLQAIANFKADYVDAYDSNCDDEATANAIFMANLSSVSSLNDGTVVPRYDSDIHSEVPHYDIRNDEELKGTSS